MVFLKLQSYRQQTVAVRTCLKLCSKYFGPYEILERIGQVAYKLKLPPGSRVHPVFHVSLLKKQVGSQQVISTPLPEMDDQDCCPLKPAAVLQRRTIIRQQKHITQWLIQWAGLTPEEASWEDLLFILHLSSIHFQNSSLEDKSCLKERVIVSSIIIGIIGTMSFVANQTKRVA